MTIVGIDLGTTNSAIGYMSDRGPILIANSLNQNLTPSVVGIDRDGAVLVGEAARELQVVAPERCASDFKRHMGTDWTIELDDKLFKPTDLSSLVLRSLVADAEEFLGEKVTHAVITVPAYFNDRQRRATILAGEMAGLKVERIINEPTAAAIAYGLPAAEDEKLVAVLDLGGGTFDVSIVEFFEGVVEVRASSGECFLGGEDFTRMLASRILDRQGYLYERAEFEQPLMVSRLRRSCEAAKVQLSRDAAAEVRVPDQHGQLTDRSSTCRVTADQFHEWTESLLAQTEPPVRRALGDAGLRPLDMDEVILVGGATRMPSFRERVAGKFGKEPRCSINPDEVVALGAAVQAGLFDRNAALDDVVVTDVAPFTLGFEISKQFGTEYRRGYFSPLINRNTPIPVSRSDVVGTIQSNQTEIRVSVYQGENRRVEQNLFLGEFLVNGIPSGPPGTEVEIRFTYDLNGVLEVEATVVETKKKSSLVITRHAEGMSKSEVAAAVKAMQAIKLHPRNETTNRLLLRRSERLYQELSLLERDQLEHLMDGFEYALEMGDPEVIEKFKHELRAFLERFDGGSTEPDQSF